VTCVSRTLAREIGKYTKNHGNNMIRKISPEAHRRTQRPQIGRHRKLYGSDTEDRLTRCAGFRANDSDVPERKVDGLRGGSKELVEKTRVCGRPVTRTTSHGADRRRMR